MEGHPGIPPPSLITHYWAPGWNSVQALSKFQSEVGGALRGGSAGIRLLPPSTPSEEARFFAGIPARFEPRPDRFLVVPLPHIFGSEETSALSGPVAARAPVPYVAVRPDEAETLGIPEGPVTVLSIGDQEVALPVAYRPDLPPGVAGVPAGMTSIRGIPLPAWGRIRGGEAP
jgi:NADH-quinone oxidoreductase subunit G